MSDARLEACTRSKKPTCTDVRRGGLELLTGVFRSWVDHASLTVFCRFVNAGFNNTGHISILGSHRSSSSVFNYSYDVRIDNANLRTLQLLSTEANLTMRKSENPCSVCPYIDDFQKFVDYYGEFGYADKVRMC